MVDYEKFDDEEEEMLTVLEVAELTGLKRDSIHNYISGRYEPVLETSGYGMTATSKRPGRLISRKDFESWWTRMKKRKPQGANLHKDRQAKAG